MSPDIGRLSTIKMAATKPEVHHISGMEQDGDQIPTPNPTFAWSRNSTVQFLILSDVSESRKFKMAATKPEVHHISETEQDSDENSRCLIDIELRTFNDISLTVLQANAYNTLKLSCRNSADQLYFRFAAAILIFHCRPTPGNVNSISFESGVV